MMVDMSKKFYTMILEREREREKGREREGDVFSYYKK